MTTIRVSETQYNVTTLSPSSVTISEDVSTVEIRGGIASSVADLTTQANVGRVANDLLAWNASSAQFEPVRISASGGVTLTYTFLSDLDYDDGAWDFSFAEGSAQLVMAGLL